MSPKKTLHKLIVRYLVNETAYGMVARREQLDAAAKKIARSGSLPKSVADRLGLSEVKA